MNKDSNKYSRLRHVTNSSKGSQKCHRKLLLMALEKVIPKLLYYQKIVLKTLNMSQFPEKI